MVVVGYPVIYYLFPQYILCNVNVCTTYYHRWYNDVSIFKKLANWKIILKSGKQNFSKTSTTLYLFYLYFKCIIYLYSYYMYSISRHTIQGTNHSNTATALVALPRLPFFRFPFLLRDFLRDCLEFRFSSGQPSHSPSNTLALVHSAFAVGLAALLSLEFEYP